MKKEVGQFTMQIGEKEALIRLSRRLTEQKLRMAYFQIGDLKVTLEKTKTTQ